MEQHLETLKANKIKCAAFYEPNLNYALTAICFLVDERVFNKKDYPDFEQPTSENFLNLSDLNDYEAWEVYVKKSKYQFVKEVGKDVAFLKDFLKQFRLA